MIVRRLIYPILTWFAWVGIASMTLAQGYVGSVSCAECHAEEVRAWEESHHAKAWVKASPENILADFGASEFTLGDMSVRFHQGDGGIPIATVRERDGTVASYPVHSVVGIEPLQQYLFETEPGRLQSFDVVWDTENQGWFHLYPDLNPPPSDGLHWSGPYKTWNGRCAVCHATGYDAGYDAQTRSYQSSQVEIGVGCEACHGPGDEHVNWAKRDAGPDDIANFGFSADFSTPEGLIQQCAGCHSRREALFDHSPEPGTPYHDAYNLSLLRPGLYYPDGQIRDEVYVYGSFLQSKMYAQGVTCTDCHDAHTGQLIGAGNTTCTQCHSPAGNARFPTLPLAEFDSPEHHHHSVGSIGAECKSCHMPEQVYMGNDWRADHSFRIPRPDLSAQTRAPDACTSCHTDRSADWAADILEQWFPNSTNRGSHFGSVLARAERNLVDTTGDLVGVAQNQDHPAIARATAIWLIGQSREPDRIAQIADLVDTDDPTIRAAVLDALRHLPAQRRVPIIVSMLNDPYRNVRITAAKGLLNAPIARMPEDVSASFRVALTEWQNALGARLDFPETHMQLGGFALITRNLPAAEKSFEVAVSLDPKLAEAWGMRIRLAAISGDTEKLSRLAEEARGANPNDLLLEQIISEVTGEFLDLLPPRSD